MKRSPVHRCRTLRQQYAKAAEAWERENEELDWFYSGRTHDDPLHTAIRPKTTPTMRLMQARMRELQRKMERYGCVIVDRKKRNEERQQEKQLRRTMPF
jgi:hypothetical protein